VYICPRNNILIGAPPPAACAIPVVPVGIKGDQFSGLTYNGDVLKTSHGFNFWRFYPGTLEWYPNPCFGGLTPIYPHFNAILRDF